MRQPTAATVVVTGRGRRREPAGASHGLPRPLEAAEYPPADRAIRAATRPGSREPAGTPCGRPVRASPACDWPGPDGVRPMRRVPAAFAASVLTCALVAAPTVACGGLIGPNGAVNLLRTTTFVGYHEGIEHYVTAFAFAGGGGAFGSITPLPGIPTSVDKGGDWTLQRLIRETEPPPPEAVLRGRRRASAPGGVEVLLETTIDALDITVLKGGGDEVGAWAADHGFRLPPDAPEVLDFYAQRSPIFLAASFDADAAAGTWPGHRRRHTRAHHHPDLRPVGAAAHPVPGQAGRRSRGRGRVPAHRPRADPAAGGHGRWPVPGSHGPGQRLAARRPAVGPGHGLGA